MSPGQESVNRYLASIYDTSWTPQDVGEVVEKVQAAAYQAGWDAAKAEYIPVLTEHLRILADLRAQVKALDWWIDDDSVADPLTTAVVYRDDVLALFGGSDDLG